MHKLVFFSFLGSYTEIKFIQPLMISPSHIQRVYLGLLAKLAEILCLSRLWTVKTCQNHLHRNAHFIIRRPQPTAGGARQRRDYNNYKQQGPIEAWSMNTRQQARDKKPGRRSKGQEERCKREVAWRRPKAVPWWFGPATRSFH
jgi:hypothetical protein